jgi:DnaJ-class molecular chaperone
MRGKMRQATAALVSAGVIACCLSAGAADVGKLYVRSKPSRASVYLNDEAESRGKTPCYLRGLPIGDYTVRVHLRGYVDVSEEVEVLLGTKSSVVLKLTERLPEDAEDAEGAEDTDASAEEGPDHSTDETEETEEPDTSPSGGSRIPRYVYVDCPVCVGTGLLRKKGCDTCKATGKGGHGGCASCEGTGRADFRCPICLGSGAVERGEKQADCRKCRGKGRFQCRLCAGKGKLRRPNPEASRRPTAPCVACEGTGFEHRARCSTCSGKGKVAGGHHTKVDCWYCGGDGKGQPRCKRCRGIGVVGSDKRRTACWPCFATGRLWVPCKTCRGKGWQVVEDE